MQGNGSKLSEVAASASPRYLRAIAHSLRAEMSSTREAVVSVSHCRRDGIDRKFQCDSCIEVRFNALGDAGPVLPTIPQAGVRNDYQQLMIDLYPVETGFIRPAAQRTKLPQAIPLRA